MYAFRNTRAEGWLWIEGGDLGMGGVDFVFKHTEATEIERGEANLEKI